MLQPPTKFEVKFVGDTLSVSALIVLVTLTFDLLTSNLVSVIARYYLSTNFGVFRTFRYRVIGQAVCVKPIAITCVSLLTHVENVGTTNETMT